MLYTLGLTAARAGHYTRARDALAAALRQQPANVDVLYALASADVALQHWEAALELFAQAAKIDPKRPGIQKMIALAATELDALEDAAVAWDLILPSRPKMLPPAANAPTLIPHGKAGR